MDVSLTLEFHKDAFHEFAVCRLTKNAGAVAFVEVFFEAFGEAAVELEFLFGSPGFRVLFDEDFPVLLPLGKLGGGEGITEAEGDELYHAVLLPVGEFGTVFLDFPGEV